MSADTLFQGANIRGNYESKDEYLAEVRTARDGDEALRIVERHPMDVAILDIGLPGLDGYQLARVLRGRSASTRTTLIALTGYSQPDDVARAAAAGFDNHIVKPADPDSIATLVEAADVPADARGPRRPKSAERQTSLKEQVRSGRVRTAAQVGGVNLPALQRRRTQLTMHVATYITSPAQSL